MAKDCIWPGGLTSCDLYCSAGGRNWPDSAVSRIRRARQLSGDKLPSLGRRATTEDDPMQTFARSEGCKRRPCSLTSDANPPSSTANSMQDPGSDMLPGRKAREDE